MKKLAKIFLILLVTPVLFLLLLILVPALLLLMFLFSIFARRQWSGGINWHSTRTAPRTRGQAGRYGEHPSEVIDVEAVSVSKIDVLDTTPDSEAMSDAKTHSDQ